MPWSEREGSQTEQLNLCAQTPVRSAPHTETHASSPHTQDGGHLTPALAPVATTGVHLAGVRTAGHAQPGTEGGKPKPRTEAIITWSLQSPGCSLLRPGPAPSFRPLVISNAHLFPLIKGIIIYNFLLKNQLCTLSIANRNSQLVTWLEKIDRNSSSWRKKRRLL